MEIQTLQRDIEVQERQIENLEQFIQRVHKYKDLDELIPYALREFVKGIYIEVLDKSSGKRWQNICISYDLMVFIPPNDLTTPEHLRGALSRSAVLSRPAFVAGQTYRVLCGGEALTAFEAAMSKGSGGMGGGFLGGPPRGTPPKWPQGAPPTPSKE